MGSSLDGRVALVTGAGRGIGAAIATRLAADGAAVAVNDLDAATAQATVDRIRDSGGSAVAVPGDIGEPSLAGRIVDGTAGQLGALDVLVNNAGILHRVPFREYTTGQWHRILAVNLSAPFFLAQAAVDHLAASGHGAIVNICSVAVTGFFRQIGYDASKGGLLTL
ncbi:SDR family NAD(P)-dependent oxidoreductase, partial [Amycolatopsis rhizosphaerae]